MASRIPFPAARLGARFGVAVSVLLLLWTQVAGFYTASLVTPANWLLELRDAPMVVSWTGETCLVALSAIAGAGQVLQLQGDELAYVNLVVALAVLAAIPGMTLQRRASWALGVVAVLWASHVLTLYGGTCAAVSVYLSTVPGADGVLSGHWLAHQGAGLERLIGRWSAWGSPALILLVSAMAFPRGIWRDAHA